MILGFKPEMVEPYVNKQKKHSIRIDKHNRWKAGRSIQLATGVRTKNYKQFGSETCKSTQIIEIVHTRFDSRKIRIDDKLFYCNNKLCDFCIANTENREKEMLVLAKNDGFDSIDDFFEWFNKSCEGKIIHWTDLKY